MPDGRIFVILANWRARVQRKTKKTKLRLLSVREPDIPIKMTRYSYPPFSPEDFAQDLAVRFYYGSTGKRVDSFILFADIVRDYNEWRTIWFYGDRFTASFRQQVLLRFGWIAEVSQPDLGIVEGGFLWRYPTVKDFVDDKLANGS